jgi:hypothetical protein
MKNCNCKVKYSHGGLINPYRFSNGGITFGGSSLKYDPLNKNILTSANVNLRSGNLDIGGVYTVQIKVLLNISWEVLVVLILVHMLEHTKEIMKIDLWVD